MENLLDAVKLGFASYVEPYLGYAAPYLGGVRDVFLFPGAELVRHTFGDPALFLNDVAVWLATIFTLPKDTFTDTEGPFAFVCAAALWFLALALLVDIVRWALGRGRTENWEGDEELRGES